MCRWFNNHGKVEQGDLSLTQDVVSLKPRATNAISLFAKDHSEEITTRMATLRAEEGTNAKELNLRYHRTIKNDMFENTDCKVFNFNGEFLGSVSTNSRPDIYGELATQERIAYLSTNRIYIGGIKGDAKQLSIAVK